MNKRQQLRADIISVRAFCDRILPKLEGLTDEEVDEYHPHIEDAFNAFLHVDMEVNPHESKAQSD